MAEIKYNSIQIKELLQNKYVKKCSNKNITFSKECKIKSVELWNSGFPTKEIFRQLKFPEYIQKSEIPSKSVNRWRKSIEKWNIEEKRWRKLGLKSKKVDFKKLTNKAKIEYLEVEVAYLRELYKEKHWFYP